MRRPLILRVSRATFGIFMGVYFTIAITLFTYLFEDDLVFARAAVTGVLSGIMFGGIWYVLHPGQRRKAQEKFERKQARARRSRIDSSS